MFHLQLIVCFLMLGVEIRKWWGGHNYIHHRQPGKLWRKPWRKLDRPALLTTLCRFVLITVNI